MGIKEKGEIRRFFFFGERGKLERSFSLDKKCMNYSEASFPLYRAPWLDRVAVTHGSARRDAWAPVRCRRFGDRGTKIRDKSRGWLVEQCTRNSHFREISGPRTKNPRISLHPCGSAWSIDFSRHVRPVMDANRIDFSLSLSSMHRGIHRCGVIIVVDVARFRRWF